MPGPCYPCQAVGYVMTAAMVVFVGGYILKGVYLYNDPNAGFTVSYIASSQFWVPDGIFWICGLGVLVLLYAFAGAMYLLYVGSAKAMQFLCCKMLFFWCPCNPYLFPADDELSSLQFELLPTDPDYVPRRGGGRRGKRPPRKTPAAASLLLQTAPGASGEEQEADDEDYTKLV